MYFCRGCGGNTLDFEPEASTGGAICGEWSPWTGSRPAKGLVRLRRRGWRQVIAGLFRRVPVGFRQSLQQFFQGVIGDG